MSGNRVEVEVEVGGRQYFGSGGHRPGGGIVMDQLMDIFSIIRSPSCCVVIAH